MAERLAARPSMGGPRAGQCFAAAFVHRKTLHRRRAAIDSFSESIAARRFKKLVVQRRRAGLFLADGNACHPPLFPRRAGPVRPRATRPPPQRDPAPKSQERRAGKKWVKT